MNNKFHICSTCNRRWTHKNCRFTGDVNDLDFYAKCPACYGSANDPLAEFWKYADDPFIEWIKEIRNDGNIS